MGKRKELDEYVVVTEDSPKAAKIEAARQRFFEYVPRQLIAEQCHLDQGTVDRLIRRWLPERKEEEKRALKEAFSGRVDEMRSSFVSIAHILKRELKRIEHSDEPLTTRQLKDLAETGSRMFQMIQTENGLPSDITVEFKGGFKSLRQKLSEVDFVEWEVLPEPKKATPLSLSYVREETERGDE